MILFNINKIRLRKKLTMFDLEIKLENFLSIKEATVKSKNNITVIIAPNRAGKTQLMLLIYSIFWSWWRENIDRYNHSILLQKLKSVYLLKSINDLVKWDKNKLTVELKSSSLDFFYRISIIEDEYKESSHKIKPKNIEKNPIYLQLAGLGDYYKGIHSLKKYYPQWKLISEAITDFISDLFIVSSEKGETDKENKKLLELFEKLFSAKFYIQNERIYIQEKTKKYSIEKTASGLKSLSWFYLIIRYNLVGNILFIDEPEVNLHPIYIDRLAYFLYRLSEGRKIFIATHSDYLLESFNKLIAKNNFKIDVWEGVLSEDGAIYNSYEADKDNLIDTTPLNETYIKIVKELFEYEEDIEL